MKEWGVDINWTLFLDRDGVINHRKEGGYIGEWSDFHYYKEADKAIVKLSKIFGKLLVVTNQQGINKGLVTASQVEQLHTQLQKDISQKGGNIQQVYCCPHLAEAACNCRKPALGMAQKAKKDCPTIDFSKSIMIGDSKTDLEFGRKLGMKTVLVVGKGEMMDANLIDVVVDGLPLFLEMLKQKQTSIS